MHFSNENDVLNVSESSKYDRETTLSMAKKIGSNFIR